MEQQMISRILATIGIVAIASPLSAGHCVQQVRSYSYQQPVYLQQVYAPYYYAVGSQIREEAVAERIARKVEAKLSSKIKALETAKPDHPGKVLLTQHCAKCHQPGTKAVTEKEAPVFFSDAQTLKELSDAQRKKIDEAVHDGHMPPAPAEPLSDADYLAIRTFLFPRGEK
jgi:mono/diheme cytochrome c family protein